MAGQAHVLRELSDIVRRCNKGEELRVDARGGENHPGVHSGSLIVDKNRRPTAPCCPERLCQSAGDVAVECRSRHGIARKARGLQGWQFAKISEDPVPREKPCALLAFIFDQSTSYKRRGGVIGGCFSDISERHMQQIKYGYTASKGRLSQVGQNLGLGCFLHFLAVRCQEQNVSATSHFGQLVLLVNFRKSHACLRTHPGYLDPDTS